MDAWGRDRLKKKIQFVPRVVGRCDSHSDGGWKRVHQSKRGSSARGRRDVDAALYWIQKKPLKRDTSPKPHLPRHTVSLSIKRAKNSATSSRAGDAEACCACLDLVIMLTQTATSTAQSGTAPCKCQDTSLHQWHCALGDVPNLVKVSILVCASKLCGYLSLGRAWNSCCLSSQSNLRS